MMNASVAACHAPTTLRPLPPASLKAPGPQAGGFGMGTLPWSLVDEIECGLIVCDGLGAIQFANRTALRELAQGRLLGRQAGCLRLAPQASGALDVAMRQAAERGKRTLVQLSMGDDRLLASVLPLPSAPDGEPLVLVMLGRRQLCSDLGLEMLASSYGLTYTERRVLAGLLREATPRQIAQEHAVAITTVRTHISAIRAKLGTRSIDGLLLRAAEVPPVASALRGSLGHEGLDAPAHLIRQNDTGRRLPGLSG